MFPLTLLFRAQSPASGVHMLTSSSEEYFPQKLSKELLMDYSF